MKFKKILSTILCVVMVITSVLPNFALGENNISDLLNGMPTYENVMLGDSGDEGSQSFAPTGDVRPYGWARKASPLRWCSTILTYVL